jgi:hypothetical protein
MKRHRGWNLAAGQCRKPEELTQGDCGFWRKLAATCRKVSHHAWHKGYIVKKNQARNNVARGAPRGQTFGKRHEVDLEGSTGVKDPGMMLAAS